MIRLLLARLATLIPTLVGVSVVAFALIRLVPGDPIEIMMGERRLDPAAHAALMQQLGLDQPLPVQYLRYVGQLLQGDLGKSLVTREPVVAGNSSLNSAATGSRVTSELPRSPCSSWPT